MPLFPTYTAGPGAMALVGRGRRSAGIIRTPADGGSVIMIFEITRDYTIIVRDDIQLDRVLYFAQAPKERSMKRSAHQERSASAHCAFALPGG